MSGKQFRVEVRMTGSGNADWYSKSFINQYLFSLKGAIKKAEEIESPRGWGHFGVQARVVHDPTDQVVWHYNLSFQEAKEQIKEKIKALNKLNSLLP